MDERYPDRHLPQHLQATTLTGMIIAAERHRQLREGFYELVSEALAAEGNQIPGLPVVHACNLFPDKDDKTKFKFLDGLVQLVISLGPKVIRLGYTSTSISRAFGKCDVDPTIGLLFTSMLWCIEADLQEAIIWPVMEIDHTSAQDAAFAGHIQTLDYLTSRLDSRSMSIANRNLGEVLYTTKRSASGAVVDCIAYLLHARTIRNAGVQLSSFKSTLATIGDGLMGCIARDEIIELQHGQPSPDYRADGPCRYVFPITPTDSEPSEAA